VDSEDRTPLELAISGGHKETALAIGKSIASSFAQIEEKNDELEQELEDVMLEMRGIEQKNEEGHGRGDGSEKSDDNNNNEEEVGRLNDLVASLKDQLQEVILNFNFTFFNFSFFPFKPGHIVLYYTESWYLDSSFPGRLTLQRREILEFFSPQTLFFELNIFDDVIKKKRRLHFYKLILIFLFHFLRLVLPRLPRDLHHHPHLLS
jgi:hypothetical protein